MKLSEHMAHCLQLLARFGDADVKFVAQQGENYVDLPRVTYRSYAVNGSDYSISNAFRGQFT